MRKLFFLLAITQLKLSGLLVAQERSRIPNFAVDSFVITNLNKDSTKARDRASATLRDLKHGSLIVRLKTNQKSVDAYRKAGKEEIAQRIEVDRRNQNLKMYWAFKSNFRFCKVYFIYANETLEFLNGAKDVFLNKDLRKDSSITFSDTTFVFCEYGSAQPFADFEDNRYDGTLRYTPGVGLRNAPPYNDAKILDTIPVEKSTSTATSSGLVLSDKNLRQLGRPFPYVIGVYGDGFNAPVKALNRELERAYGRLVVRKDYKQKIKEIKKRQKDQWKPSDQ